MAGGRVEGHTLDEARLDPDGARALLREAALQERERERSLLT